MYFRHNNIMCLSGPDDNGYISLEGVAAVDVVNLIKKLSALYFIKM